MDGIYAFAFEVTDDALLKQLVAEWNLTPASATNLVGSAVASNESRPAWWPDNFTLARMPVRFGRFGSQSERYWSVWYDPNARRLYAEYGVL